MQVNRDILEVNQDGGDSIKNFFSKYAAYYPLIILSLVIFIGAGYYYIRITPPKYEASVMLMIKTGEDASYGGEGDLVGNALAGKSGANIAREVVQLKSGIIMRRVVAKYGFNTSYFLKGKVLTTDIYKNAPFQLIVKSLTDSLSTVRITLSELSQKGGSLLYGSNDDQQKFSFAWNVPFTYKGNTYVLVPKQGMDFDPESTYIVRWRSVNAEAGSLQGKFSAKEEEEGSSILTLRMKAENLARCEDVLNAICTEYNLFDIEERNKLSESTVRFIDERLNVISGELKSVEGNLESYQGSRNLVNIQSQADMSFGNSNAISNSIQEINIKQGVVAMISNYFNNANSAGKLVPSSMGLDDATLAALIGQYNALQLKKDREAPLVGPNSLLIQDIDNQLGSLKASILESLAGISRNLRLQEGRLHGQNSQHQQFLSSLPHNERVMQEIKRKQGITEGLYLYLLQKREEAAISSTTASISHYKQVDPASGYGPVEPNKMNIYLTASLLGFFLPLGFVYVKQLLNDKIETRDEIVKHISVPVIGDIAHASKAKSRILTSKSRNLLSEQLRLIRTNLSFMFKNKKVFLVTSSVGGEGKSTTSINLASVLAMAGKKVALLEFDIRKPSISQVLGFDNSRGITDFLNGEISGISSISQTLEQTPNLHVFSSGPVPLNPADVLLSERVAELFELLKKSYDYIIVDSAPSGMVSDAYLLNHYCDATLFIIRQRFTEKKQLKFINDLHALGKLKNMAVILNDVKTGGRYGYYGYGYDDKNGYYENGGKKRIRVFNWKKSKKTV
ncbi:MAG TPA: polysaccharide biosynthesis tyrosine autokinase [Flavisolibacter sp.]|jgi:capsular exopolysaccharide synthesis family protein|nr:polysaccharide biosynthesis tyrosine autokinase [Flavisolibacter sp.]